VSRGRATPPWLALREPADAAARAPDLVDTAHRMLSTGRPLVIHDLACGTGSMMRWLAPRLAEPQRWVCYDLDTALLDTLEGAPGLVAADGSAVAAEPRHRDVTRLASEELADADVITGSALLDLLTAAELRRLVGSCAGVGCPVLLTLTVTGAVQLWPAHPLDEVVAAAFNAHQRRATDAGTLLGPGAADAAAHEFAALGRDVVTRASPWRLGSATAALTYTWLVGWLAAAREQDPYLTAETSGYARQRLADAAAGRLRVLVQHRDLLVYPAGARRTAEPADVHLRVEQQMVDVKEVGR
jgi:hypothetical protein